MNNVNQKESQHQHHQENIYKQPLLEHNVKTKYMLIVQN